MYVIYIKLRLSLANGQNLTLLFIKASFNKRSTETVAQTEINTCIVSELNNQNIIRAEAKL